MLNCSRCDDVTLHEDKVFTIDQMKYVCMICKHEQLQWIKSVDIRPTATYNPQQGLRQRKFWTKTPT